MSLPRIIYVKIFYQMALFPSKSTMANITLSSKRLSITTTFKNKINPWRSDRYKCQICSRYFANVPTSPMFANVGYFQLYWCSIVKTLSNFSLVKCKSFVSALCSFLNEGVILKSKQSTCHLGFCKLCKLCCKFCCSSLFCIRHWVNKYHQIVIIITKIFSNKVINLLPLELQRCWSR